MSAEEQRKLREQNINRFFGMIKKISGGGADMSVEGRGGTLTPKSFVDVMSDLVEGKRVADLGSGAGHAIGACLIMGAASAYGIELGVNEHLFHITKALQLDPKVNALIPGFAERSRFYPDDIEDLRKHGLQGSPQLIFSFWDGMHENTRDAICSLVKHCRECETFIATNSQRDSVESVLESLGTGWVSREPIQVHMSGSGETKRAWIFTRQDPTVPRSEPFEWLDGHYIHKIGDIDANRSKRSKRQRTT